MNKFTVMLDNEATAVQIADLLNSYNKLRKRHTYHSIISSPVEYFVKHGLAKNDLCVVGCVGNLLADNNFTLIKHLCVHEDYRRQKIAECLLTVAVNAAKTPYVYMTIREDNEPCLKLAYKLGFYILQREATGSHYVLTVGKQKV